jgi:hypothetical protein
MGSGRGKKNEQAALQTAQTAYKEYTPDPLEEMRKKRTMKFLGDFDSGKDVKDMEALSPFLNLYNNAKNSQSNQQIGRGVVALGRSGNTDAQVSDLDKYVQAQREQDASGMLYDAANEGYQNAVNESQNLINIDQTRKANRAGIANQMYGIQLNRPKQKPLWERLLGIGASAGSTIAGGWLAGRGE